jgi:hypothetical protein
MKKKSLVSEEDLLIRISSLIDRLIMTSELEFRNTDIELLRTIERYLCEQIVIKRRKND